MKKQYKVIVVGGGASGLMSAVELTSGCDGLNGDDVLLLERNDRVAKKLVATGNGQGNLCNRNFGAEFYHGDKAFISSFIDNCKKIDVERYLNNLHIPTVADASGKVYPLSKQSSAASDIIRKRLSDSGVICECSSKVTDIYNNGGGFAVRTGTAEYFAENVILAVGGKAAKQFGTDGSSYDLAKKFSHKLTPLYPSLVQIKTETEKIKGLKGLKEQVKLTVLSEDKPIKTFGGELLFTDYGVSGSVVFAASSYLNANDEQTLKIEFVPSLTEAELRDMLTERFDDGLNGEFLYVGVVNKRIGNAVVNAARARGAAEVAVALKDFRLKVKGTLGFDYAQVTKGGIDTSDVNPDTMESRKQTGLFLTGEMLNVDGDCGGYNLTFAFVGGILAAKAIKTKYKK